MLIFSYRLLQLVFFPVILFIGLIRIFNKKENFFVKAFKLKDPVIDTTGAGDAFNGAFAVALSKDLNIKEALTFANKVAGISTTKQGAAASMPSLEDLKNY